MFAPMGIRPSQRGAGGFRPTALSPRLEGHGYVPLGIALRSWLAPSGKAAKEARPFAAMLFLVADGAPQGGIGNRFAMMRGSPLLVLSENGADAV